MKGSKLYYLPGGGAESFKIKKELKRECAEEIRVSINFISSSSLFVELRNHSNKIYLTQVFVAKRNVFLKQDLRTREEKSQGLSVCWLSIDEAKKILSKQNSLVSSIEKAYRESTIFNIVRDNIAFNHYLRKKKDSNQYVHKLFEQKT